ncbi:hemerythrin domain-containing protein [Williamwhitmania taraxaci]|uniref:Regulator of cell morphogenesis and NO signaling n=1 Tax=Williamwhitmania taraxaci TaxID=1640674 RepID=A0A1G6IW10_9BACT|nr:hemerythrin domain-containing protein [Williamwhitmania taraxaci]SDC10235.1 regulator of cell morphogenesis and NO signaling [Williamwhitmania taraxaci]
MIITHSTKMAEVIHDHIQLLPIIHRFGIRLGFGEKTVAQVCDSYSVDVDFFLETTNLFCDELYTPSKKASKYGVEVVVNYLLKSHAYFYEEKFISIREKIQLLAQYHGGEAHVGLIDKFFSNYVAEFMEHIRFEDSVVFPYSIMISDCFVSGVITPDLKNRMENYSMSVFNQQHEDIEEKLSDLRNILIKYLPPIDNGKVVTAILLELSSMEKELEDHTVIEERILVPKVLAMEIALKRPGGYAV